MPRTRPDWIRAAFFGCWIALLWRSTLDGVPDGDEGEVFTFIVAGVVLVVFALARRIEVQREERSSILPGGELQEAS
jgi:hypothetical protein